MTSGSLALRGSTAERGWSVREHVRGVARKGRECEGGGARGLKRGVGAELSHEVGVELEREVVAGMERAVNMLKGGDLGASLLDEGHVEQPTVARGRLPPLGGNHAAQQRGDVVVVRRLSGQRR